MKVLPILMAPIASIPPRFRSTLRSWTRQCLFGLCALPFSLALAACGGTDPAPTANGLGNQPMDAAAMEELLTIEDIEAAGGDTSRLQMEVEDVLAAANAVTPGEHEEVASWHAMKVKRGKNSTVLIFTVTDYVSAEDARVRLAELESGLGFVPMSTPVADDSAMLSSSSGTGLAFVKGRRAVTLQTIIADLTEPILNDDGVEQLARTIAGRL